jgi:hypothetical protein
MVQCRCGTRQPQQHGSVVCCLVQSSIVRLWCDDLVASCLIMTQEAERSRAEAALASSWAVASVQTAQQSAVRHSVRSRLR